MKKLMVVAALAAACAGLADGIESSNICGYITKPVDDTLQMVTPTFTGVGQSSINLQSIKLKNGVGDQSESIQILENGSTVATYYYLGDAYGMDEGWYDDAWTMVEGVSIQPGQSFMISSASGATDTEIVFAGEVYQNVIKLAFDSSLTCVGNGAPIPLDIQDLKLENGVGDQSESIQILENGSTVATYYYLGDAYGMDEGWYDDAWALVEATIAPGAGFMISTASGATDTKFVIPNPIAE